MTRQDSSKFPPEEEASHTLSSGRNLKKSGDGKGKSSSSQSASKENEIAAHCSSRLDPRVHLHHHTIVAAETGEKGGSGEVARQQAGQGDRQDERPVPGEQHWQRPPVREDVGKDEKRQEDDADEGEEEEQPATWEEGEDGSKDAGGKSKMEVGEAEEGGEVEAGLPGGSQGGDGVQDRGEDEVGYQAGEKEMEMAERKRRNFGLGEWLAVDVSLVEEIEGKGKVYVKGSEVGGKQEDETINHGDPWRQARLRLDAAEQRCDHSGHTGAQEHSARVDAGQPGSKAKDTGCVNPAQEEVEEEQEEEEVGVEAGHH